MRQVDVNTLAELLHSPRPPVLLDVREPWECEICSMPGATEIPMAQIPNRLDELDRDAHTIVICHHGMRSAQVTAFLDQAGFTQACNLAGGIDAWARVVDADMATY